MWKARNVIVNRDWLVQKEIEDYLVCLAVLVFLEKWVFLDCQDMDHKEYEVSKALKEYLVHPDYLEKLVCSFLYYHVLPNVGKST